MIIKIKNLKIDTILGVYEWENNYPRTLLFNVEIQSNCDQSMISDNIKDTIDYDHVTNQIRDYVVNNRCHLIEKMVGEILDLIMQDQRISKCTLEVDKLKVYDFVDSFSVTQTRIR
ncbi:MAG: dihydroneopterin aldolase [Pseudomonadota bacterium]